jgi:hypothetical protein
MTFPPNGHAAEREKPESKEDEPDPEEGGTV